MNKYYYILERLYDISILTFLIPSIIAIFRWKFFNLHLKIIAVSTFRVLIISSIALFFNYIKYDNRFFYYLSPCLDILVISWLVASFYNNKKLNIGLLLICVIYISLMIYDYFHSTSMISTYLTNSETLFVIIVLLILLRKIILSYKSGVYKRSLIFTLVALLIANLFSLLVVSFNQVMLDYSGELLRFCWYLSSPIIITLTNLLTAYGFFIIKHQIKGRT